MQLLRKISKTQIFQKVVEIANNQKDKIKSKFESNNITPNHVNTVKQKLQSQQSYKEQVQLSYGDAQFFILQLSSNSKQIKKQQMQKKSKKQIFSELQIQPIYLQSCNFNQLFKMELQFNQHGGYQRTQILHNYLKQVNDTIKKIILTENYQILDSFQLINRYLQKVSIILVKIKVMRSKIVKQRIQKGIKIKQIMNKKLIIRQKLSLLSKMRQKKQISLIKPVNIQQIYYSQRGRHKLYIKIKNMKIVNSYFNMLKSQIICISQNNKKIIEELINKWINKQQQLRQKNIQKLLICMYFIKNELIYKQNKIKISFKEINKDKLINQINKVKKWNNYQYIKDPIMKSKISQFLNLLIQDIINQYSN